MGHPFLSTGDRLHAFACLVTVTTRIRTLGTLQIFSDSAELLELPSQRLKCALLVYLGVERHATRAGLMALFWPEKNEERARHSLSQALYQLRQTLGREWLDARGDLLSVTDEIAVDAVGFRQAIEGKDFESATALYEGPFLKGIHLVDTTGFESWVDHQRDGLARLHRSARSEVVSRYRSQGDLTKALDATREWVEHDVLDEEAQHLLIRLLAEAGRRTDAIRQFERYKEQLAEALDMDPSDETRDLAARIRSGAFGPPSSDPGEGVVGQVGRDRRRS